MKIYTENIIKVPRFNEAAGFYTTKARSDLMSKIRSKETKPEIQFRKVLWGLGLRYRKNVKKLQGTPDIVFTKFKLIIFIDGEFWHGYNWEEKKRKIKSNRDFWIPKIERNMQRDRQNNRKLEEQGWTVLRFWDSEIKKELGACLNRVLIHLDNFEKFNTG
ncbi:MAG: very short patch repair endonuclease [Draconibacterium sp.]|nr:very short patch repair endonuclease [Draconibacterium sp.]